MSARMFVVSVRTRLHHRWNANLGATDDGPPAPPELYHPALRFHAAPALALSVPLSTETPLFIFCLSPEPPPRGLQRVARSTHWEPASHAPATHAPARGRPKPPKPPPPAGCCYYATLPRPGAARRPHFLPSSQPVVAQHRLPCGGSGAPGPSPRAVHQMAGSGQSSEDRRAHREARALPLPPSSQPHHRRRPRPTSTRCLSRISSCGRRQANTLPP